MFVRHLYPLAIKMAMFSIKLYLFKEKGNLLVNWLSINVHCFDETSKEHIVQMKV